MTHDPCKGLSSNVAHVESLLTQWQAQQERVNQLLRPTVYTDQVAAQFAAYNRSINQFNNLFKPFEPSQRWQSALTGVMNVTSAATTAMERAMASTAAPYLPAQIESLFRSYNNQMRLIANSETVLRAFERQVTEMGQWAQYRRLFHAQEVLSENSTEVYAQLTSSPDIARQLSPWLTAAPAVEPYSSSRALAILSGVEIDLDETRDRDAEDQLSQATDDLEARLSDLGIAFVTPYRGAHVAIMSRHPDWHRHAITSLRELMGHLLRHLAPDSALDAYYEKPSDHKLNGKYTRKAQLQYIFRDIAVGSYSEMAESDMDLTLATFFPSNAAVHQLATPFTDKQLLVFWRRMQGCISVVLEAAGQSGR
jgi:hypothetical protein